MNGAPQQNWDEEVPPEVLDRMASAMLEELERTRGDIDALDIAGLKSMFPGYEAAVESQLASIRDASRPSLTVGPFRLGRTLGRGATSTVHEAWDSRSERRVALKILRTDDFHDDDSRIEREVAIQQMLRHPGIVELYECAQHDGKTCISMELVPGVSLAQIIHVARSQMPDVCDTTLSDLMDACQVRGDAAGHSIAHRAPHHSPVAVDPSVQQSLGGQYFRDVALAMASAAEAVEHAHRLGLVHRDLKPGNLLLVRDGAVKVADFGLAKGRGFLHLTQTGRFVGTPFYASPEQASSFQKVGPASDIWALGVTLYELVTLTVPFAGNSVDEVLASIQRGRFSPPRELNQRIPRDLERIILRCLERHPELRYASAGELANDLYCLACGEAVSLARISPWRRARCALKRPTPRTVCVLSLVVAIAGSLVWQVIASTMDAAASRAQKAADVAIAVERAVDAQRPTGRSLTAADLRISKDAVLNAMLIQPDSAEAQQTALRVFGLAAWHEGRMDEAAGLLSKAHAAARLNADELLKLARASFACGRLDDATSAYDGLLGATQRAEGLLVQRFIEAVPLPCAVSKAVVLTSSKGLAPGTVLALEASNPPRIRVFVDGLQAVQSASWPPPRGVIDSHPSHTDFAIADFDHDGVDELVLAAAGHVYVAEMPLTLEYAPQWQDLGDPFAAYPDLVQIQNHVHLVAMRENNAPTAGTLLLVSRYHYVVKVEIKREGGAWGARSLGLVPMLCGSDVLGLSSHVTNGRASLLAAIGPWLGSNGFSVRCFEVDRASNELAMEAATIGNPEGVLSYRPPGATDEFIFAYLGGPDFYTDHRKFWMATPLGWECGVHALRRDPQTNTLVPLASFVLPRPQRARARLSLCDVMGDATQEILVSRWIWEGQDDAMPALHETLVVQIHARDGIIGLDSVLRFPGAVAALVPLAAGGADLIVDYGARGFSAVRVGP